MCVERVETFYEHLTSATFVPKITDKQYSRNTKDIHQLFWVIVVVVVTFVLSTNAPKLHLLLKHQGSTTFKVDTLLLLISASVVAVNAALAINWGKPELSQISVSFPFCVSRLHKIVKEYLIMFLIKIFVSLIKPLLYVIILCSALIFGVVLLESLAILPSTTLTVRMQAQPQTMQSHKL